MKKRISLLFSAALLAVAGCASINPAEDNDALALRKSEPIQLFMTTCVVGRSGLPAVEQLAQKNGFRVAPSDAARHYLYGNPGKAWVLENERGSYGLSLLATKHLCSVFVHQGDPDDIQASMEAWLPPEDSDFTYTKAIVSTSGNLKTTEYNIFRGPDAVERWVITINYSQSSGLVAIMSYTGT